MSTVAVAQGDETRLRRHLALLFPGYAGDRRELLATVDEEDLGRAFRRAALDCHPDRVRVADTEMARLARERFVQLHEALEALRGHARRARQAVRALTAAPAGPRIIAVGGAKGGVGKSTLAGSLATALAMLGYRAAAVDLDLGGASLHLFLGVRAPTRTLGHFLNESATDLTEIRHPTQVERLALFAGDSSVLGAANITHAQKQRLIQNLRRLPDDVVVLDLGGDTTFNTLDFFIQADERIVVTTEDPAAVLDAYNLVKVGLFRSVTQWVAGAGQRASFSPPAEKSLERFVLGSGRTDGPTMSALTAELAAVEPAAAAAVEAILTGYRPRLVLNQGGAATGKAVIERIRDVCRQHLRIEVDLCHIVPSDPQVTQATLRISNVVSARLEGPGSQGIWAIARKLAPPASATGQSAKGRPPRPAVETRFFQPPWIFPRLPRALAGVDRDALAEREPLRAWYVGAGTGEGPYSLAIALDEAVRQIGDRSYHVWATGTSETEIPVATRAVYPLVFVEGLRPDTLKRYFLRGTGLSAGLCTLKGALRDRVTFVAGPGLDTLPPTPPVDLLFVGVAAEAFSIICRGSLGRALLDHLRPGGLLVVPAWPLEEPPLPGLRRLEGGIFVHAASARGAVRVA